MSRAKIVAPILAPNEHVSNKRNTILRYFLAGCGMSICVVLLLVEDILKIYVSFDAVLDANSINESKKTVSYTEYEYK